MQHTELELYEYIGAVRTLGEWHFFAGIIADWILDYLLYDPDYDPGQWSNIFRNNLLQVKPNQSSEFLEAMQPHKLSLEDIRHIVLAQGAERASLIVVVDFDTCQFINGFYDLALEDYVGEGWTGIFDSPYKYIPQEMRSIWEK